MAEMKTLTIGGKTFEIVDEKARAGLVDASKKAIYVGSGEMPEGYNVQIDPDGEVLTKDDIIPHVGTNKNWWIGDEDTGVSAVAREGWQLLCDTTTTEETAKFVIGKDMEGNDISCKKIIAKMVMPQALGAASSIYFGNAKGDDSTAPRCGMNTEGNNCPIYEFGVELVKNQFATLFLAQKIVWNFGSHKPNEVWVVPAPEVSSLNGFHIENATGNPFPIGTRIIVWGMTDVLPAAEGVSF